MEKTGHLPTESGCGSSGRPRGEGEEERDGEGAELRSAFAENTVGEAWVLLPLAALFAFYASLWCGILQAICWFISTFVACHGCRFARHRAWGPARAGVASLWRRAFVAGRCVQGGVWGVLPLLAWVPGDPQNLLFVLLVSTAGLALLICPAVVHGGLALAQALPLVAVSLYLYARQSFVPPLPYIAVLFPALVGAGFQIRGATVRSIRRRLELRRKQLELEAVNARLSSLASTDELTRVGNRRAFLDRATRELARADRYGRAVSIVLTDVDHFKEINDRYGHAVGDEVLRVLTEALSSSLRDTDFVARLGGDEFALLLPETSQRSAQRVAERLRRTIAELPCQAGGNAISIAVSCGVAERAPQREDLDQLVARADRALYRAKRGGRNQTAVASD